MSFSAHILLLDDGRVQFCALKSVHGSLYRGHRRRPAFAPTIKALTSSAALAEALTEKDKADIQTAALIGVDYLAVSLPRCGEDLELCTPPPRATPAATRNCG